MSLEAALERRLARWSGRADPTGRLGLGLVIGLAGAHKLVAPAAWSAYAAPIVVAVWPLPMDPTMVVNGAIEVAFGLALAADRHTTAAAAVVAVSMVGVVANLALAAAAGGAVVDILIRDAGLAVLATVVALRSAADAEPAG